MSRTALALRYPCCAWAPTLDALPKPFTASQLTRPPAADTAFDNDLQRTPFA